MAAFRSVVNRTGIVRAILAGGALALVLAAAASARDPQTTEQALIPQDTVGVVVLDLSLSITDDDYAAIRRTLRRLVAEEASIGLVVFSDVPYELLPPGTSGRGAPTLPPAARGTAPGPGAEPVDAVVPRGHADLGRAGSREVGARARRGGLPGRSCS